MRLRLVSLAAGLTALVGCDRFGGTAIDIAHPPRLKAGLWSMTGALEGRPWPPMQVCSGGDISVLPPTDSACQAQATRTPDGAIDYQAVCSKFGQTLRTRRRVVGDTSSALTMDTNSVVKKPGAADIRLSSHFQYRYQGACPPGMKMFKG